MSKSIVFCLMLIVGGILTFTLLKPRGELFADLKCPDAYTSENEYMASTAIYTNRFFDKHPGASLGDWAHARVEFYRTHNCQVALDRYNSYNPDN